MSNSDKRNNRLRLGDKEPMERPAAQPIPGLPQDQKKGNSQNYEAFDIQGQMGQLIGTGGYSMPYGDMKLPDNDLRRGTPTIMNRSVQPQNNSLFAPELGDVNKMMASYPSLTMQGTVSDIKEPDSGALVPGSTPIKLGNKNNGIA